MSGKRIERAERTRAALVAAGQRLFCERPVDAVAIDDIVQAADVSKGSFYNHFPDRDALIARPDGVPLRPYDVATSSEDAAVATEDDFRAISAHGLNLVRIPVPFFIFGDVPGHPGCVEYLDRAFDWAERAGLKVLIDLHTVPGSQNGFDNGGLTGVVRWHTTPRQVAFALDVL